MTKAEELRKAGEAANLLNNPLYNEAWNDIRNRLIEQLETVAINDPQMQTCYVLALQQLKRLRRTFETHIETGKLAEAMFDRDTR